MSWQERVSGIDIPGICFIRKPGSTTRCTRSKGHDGDHHNYYSGRTNSSGIRPGSRWPAALGETQAD
ncbi:hypothetical protein G3I40_01375 [Streptomyces sp. SID14478]|uniref:hypothetical protein n=1 Tax=Streptomyces sp. SID14478 TaxID=2706073 RepID=UPI0013D91752|nr:hypothetical protein [Streptomyces sp. SID14478]NEB73896.1 hypothetical protein [Streptomyces sp. SID14478]